MKALAEKIDETLPEELPTLGTLNDVVGLHIGLATSSIYRNFMDTFAHLEMTQKQVACLWLIGDQPGIAQTDISRLLKVDRATVMSIINRLQARKYVVRGVSNNDRRRQTLVLTPAGKIALKAAKIAIAEHEDWLKAKFTAKEVATIIALMKRIQE